MVKARELSGERFGMLVAISRADGIVSGKETYAVWNCVCDCGGTAKVQTRCLSNGGTRSCGCLRKLGNNRKHGDAKKSGPSRLYNIWGGMKDRCLNSNAKAFNAYGGRGISICQEWMEFAQFREWANSNGYTDQATIDRINTDGGYSPSNCRWATYLEQNRNKRSNRPVTRSDGKHYCSISEAAEDAGVSLSAIRAVCVGLRKRAAGFSFSFSTINQVTTWKR